MIIMKYLAVLTQEQIAVIVVLSCEVQCIHLSSMKIHHLSDGKLHRKGEDYEV